MPIFLACSKSLVDLDSRMVLVVACPNWSCAFMLFPPTVFESRNLKLKRLVQDCLLAQKAFASTTIKSIANSDTVVAVEHMRIPGTLNPKQGRKEESMLSSINRNHGHCKEPCVILCQRLL